MAGTTVAGSFQLTTTTTTANIVPPASTEWMIKNIYYDGGNIQLNIIDTNGGTTGYNVNVFDNDTAANSMQGRQFHLTPNHYIQVKFTGASGTLNVSYDGIVWNP
jgi:hypothetical protein